MFKDYYAILGIHQSATFDEIKFAYKQQALKWHPDRNSRHDANFRMQEINEAYLILKDSEARVRYDREYDRFKHFQRNHQHTQEQKTKSKSQNFNEGYTINDDLLGKWMNDAREESISMAQQTLEDLIGMVTVGAKAAVETVVALKFFLVLSAIGFIFLLLIMLIKA